MVGNDVIDLAATRKESNWQRKGFLEKLFTFEEHELIRNHESPETMVWILWSMKEAAYKVYNRQTKVRGFIPQQLLCSISISCNSIIKGIVMCNKVIYTTQTVLEGDLIHTIATANNNDIGKTQEVNSIKIVKDTLGIPYQLIENKLLPISISHHGRFYKIVSLTQY